MTAIVVYMLHSHSDHEEGNETRLLQLYHSVSHSDLEVGKRDTERAFSMSLIYPRNCHVSFSSMDRRFNGRTSARTE